MSFFICLGQTYFLLEITIIGKLYGLLRGYNGYLAYFMGNYRRTLGIQRPTMGTQHSLWGIIDVHWAFRG
ncbi:hypothetical protein TMU01_21940 [Tenuibacillus multivorans]|nr:hypothetical protein TMU01_21940 [Tenuibacillus multivorans]